MTRLQVAARGVVQGVGFRPFVYREATRRGLTGYVRNARGWVELEVQGARERLDEFLEALRSGPPPVEIRLLEAREVGERPERDFCILESNPDEAVEPCLPADLALCAECMAEIQDPRDRRYGYPFTNCTRCGPRYSIVERFPYDRASTSMKGFELCAACLREYRAPENRRYHAEPIACPACGPELSLLDVRGRLLARAKAALDEGARAIRQGQIVALKGLGGFQLLTRARDDLAVAELRRRKRREEKPFAVMFPTLDSIREVARLGEEEVELLAGPEAPIVLLERLACDDQALSIHVAGNGRYVGALLAYTPLHQLLMAEVGEPVVCTSGNSSAEPMCIETDGALLRLGGIADLFLTHDRPIVRPVDDSVARVASAGREVLRRARGFAPRPVASIDDRRTILAVGAHQKCAVALARGGAIVLSQHIGDLGNLESERLLEQTVEDLLRFFETTPDVVACDLHPDYASTRLAERIAQRSGAKLARVQHHAAHVAAIAAEHGLSGDVLGFAWDGTGLGHDGTIWGGETLLLAAESVERIAHLLAFPLPGGDRAAREPRRSAAGLIWKAAHEQFERRASAWFGVSELEVLKGALARSVNAPRCTSVGRLFDAVAALLGVREKCSYEGQAAMELEALAEAATGDEAYPLPLSVASPGVADTGALIRALFDDLERSVGRELIARRFHFALVEHALETARAARVERIVLSGGCFQNRLLERCIRQRLEQGGVSVYSAREVPCNDGGIAVGQIVLASRLAGDSLSCA